MIGGAEVIAGLAFVISVGFPLAYRLFSTKEQQAKAAEERVSAASKDTIALLESTLNIRNAEKAALLEENAYLKSRDAEYKKDLAEAKDEVYRLVRKLGELEARLGGGK